MDKFTIEYAGKTDGRSYDFTTFEHEMPTSEKDAAQAVLDRLEGEFIQAIQVTRFNVSEEISRDVTQDILDWVSELYDWEFNICGGWVEAIDYPSILEPYANAVSREYAEAA